MNNYTFLQFAIWICQKHGQPLDKMRQELIWKVLQGTKLKYIEIKGFSPNYIARVIAPKLWRQLTIYCGQKVSICRVGAVLSQTYDQLTESEQAAVKRVIPQVAIAKKIPVSPVEGEKKKSK